VAQILISIYEDDVGELMKAVARLEGEIAQRPLRGVPKPARPGHRDHHDPRITELENRRKVA
jgi:hypothetical protein